jgi:hypothetical protein
MTEHDANHLIGDSVYEVYKGEIREVKIVSAIVYSDLEAYVRAEDGQVFDFGDFIRSYSSAVDLAHTELDSMTLANRERLARAGEMTETIKQRRAALPSRKDILVISGDWKVEPSVNV